MLLHILNLGKKLTFLSNDIKFHIFEWLNTMSYSKHQLSQFKYMYKQNSNDKFTQNIVKPNTVRRYYNKFTYFILCFYLIVLLNK